MNLFTAGVSGIDHLGGMLLDKSDVTVSLHLFEGGSGERSADLHALDETGGGDELHLWVSQT